MLKSFGVTIGMALAIVVLQLLVGLVLAVLVNQRKMIWLRTIFRTAFYLPLLASTAAVSIFMGYLFDYQFGVVNYYLGLVGIPAVPWLNSPFGAATTIVLITVWQQAGFTFVLFVAALMAVPTDVLEASQIDGAVLAEHPAANQDPVDQPHHLVRSGGGVDQRHAAVRSALHHDQGRTGHSHDHGDDRHVPEGIPELGVWVRFSDRDRPARDHPGHHWVTVPRRTEVGVLPVSTNSDISTALSVTTPPPVNTPVHRASVVGQIGRIVGIAVLVLAAITALGPLLWTVSTSLRTPAEAFTNPPQWIPLHPDFSNYSAVFDQIPIGRFFINSVIVTVLIVVGQTVTCTLSGYAFAMVEFPGRNAIFVVFLATMMVPLQTIIIPVFVIIRYLGLSNSLMSLVVSALGSAFGTFLMRQYFMQLPRELGEAARIDGAGHFQVFFSVYAKMAGPAIATLAILNFSGFWAEFYRPLIFLQTQDNFTLPLGLVALQGNMGTGSISVVLAGVVLAMLPSVILFIFAQRYFIAGVTAGSSR